MKGGVGDVKVVSGEDDTLATISMTASFTRAWSCNGQFVPLGVAESIDEGVVVVVWIIWEVLNRFGCLG